MIIVRLLFWFHICSDIRGADENLTEEPMPNRSERISKRLSSGMSVSVGLGKKQVIRWADIFGRDHYWSWWVPPSARSPSHRGWQRSHLIGPQDWDCHRRDWLEAWVDTIRLSKFFTETVGFLFLWYIDALVLTFLSINQNYIRP
jgi:hypothetical protein